MALTLLQGEKNYAHTSSEKSSSGAGTEPLQIKFLHSTMDMEL
jgi:hypothetical protein